MYDRVYAGNGTVVAVVSYHDEKGVISLEIFSATTEEDVRAAVRKHFYADDEEDLRKKLGRSWALLRVFTNA